MSQQSPILGHQSKLEGSLLCAGVDPTWEVSQCSDVLGSFGAVVCWAVGTLLMCSPLGFQESALRKQSLFLKFDPLLEGSPERPAPAAPETIRCAASGTARCGGRAAWRAESSRLRRHDAASEQQTLS